MKIAIQDTYANRFRHCWGCGADNPEGLHLKSYPSEDGTHCIVKHTPGSKYTGGVPKNLFGGLMATIFDCHGTASAAWFSHREKGLELTEDTTIGRFITARIEIDYISPVPMDKELTVISTAEEITDRKVIVKEELVVDGEVRARARVVAVAVKDDM